MISESASKRWNGSGSNTREDMWAALVSDATFPAKIWVNKPIINDAYMTGMYGTTAGKYTIESSPVRNPLKITVSYYDYENGSDKAYSVTAAEPIVVKAGESLYEPAARDNRIFLGWTTDKSGASEPFKAVPTSMLGDNKLYAVWDLDKKSVNIAATGTGTDFAVDPETGEASMTFNGTGLAGSGITLTATLTTTGMSDAVVSYQWAKDGKDIESGATAQSYKVENVRESGDYTVTLKKIGRAHV